MSFHLSLPKAVDVPQAAALFRKVRHGHPMEAAPDGVLELQVGRGIAGDENQHPMSPRQVLLTRIEDLELFGIAPGQLRENIVLHGMKEEQFVPGASIEFPSGARIRLTFHCEPCKRIAHLVPKLSQLYLRRGILGVVLQGGEIRVGDSSKAELGAYEPLSLFPYERFLYFIAKVPDGRVITYKDAIAGMGVADSYFRAIPGYLKRAELGYPLHRIVDSQGCLVPYVPRQRELLAQEGVTVTTTSSHLFSQQYDRLHADDPTHHDKAADKVDLDRFRWCDETVYLR